MIGPDGARILAARQMIEAAPHRAVAAHQLAQLQLLQLADGAEPVLLQHLREGLADAPDQRHRLGGEERDRLRLADDGEAARLLEVGGDLGEELAIGEPDRDGDADLVLDLAGETGEHEGRRAAVQPLRALEVEKGLVDRDRLDQRGERLHHGADLAPDRDIFLHVRLDDHRFGAGFQRLEHRHCRAHAVDARDVAGGRDDAAFPAADDHRPVAQLRPVALLDRGVEGVAVDMGERQAIELAMAREPRAPAAVAAPAGLLLETEAVAAEPRLRIIDKHGHIDGFVQ